MNRFLLSSKKGKVNNEFNQTPGVNAVRTIFRRHVEWRILFALLLLMVLRLATIVVFVLKQL